MRAAFPAEKPVGVRVSATDWVEGGWDLEQTIAFARELKTRGCDWIHVSSGGVSPAQKIPLGPATRCPSRRRSRKRPACRPSRSASSPSPQQAEEIVASGKADIVALARGMLYDPRWPWHAAAELGATVDAPPQYWRAAPREHQALFGETVFGGR